MPKNTLFNYFTKSPACVSKTANKTLPKDVEAPAQKKETQETFAYGDIVWMQNDDLSWNLAFVRSSKNSKFSDNNFLVSVYPFADSKKETEIHPAKLHHFHGAFETEKGSRFHSENPFIQKAAKFAVGLLQVSCESRKERLVEFLQWNKNEATSRDNEDQKNKMDYQVSFKKNDNTVDSQRRYGGAVKKYRKIIYSDSDSNPSDDNDKDYTPDDNSKGKSGRLPSSSEDEGSLSEVEEEEEEEMVQVGKKRKRSSVNVKLSKPNVSQVKTKLLSFQTSATQPLALSESQPAYLHETLDFLKPDNIRDANGNKLGSPNYDGSTLKVPIDFLKKQTPAMYQWWSIKSKNYDVILFFKVGKFYELYHMDAVVGVKELGLIYMKGNFAHSGFPEVAFGRYSAALVQKGFSVARVEQTETPEQNSQRIRHKSLPKHEKTLRREICRITTKGTQIYTAWEDSSVRSHENNYLLAVCERPLYSNESDGCRHIGVCFVDTTVGVFHLNQFTDDRYCSRFRTMISHHFPCQVLYERGKLSSELSKILHTGLASVIQTGLASSSQFWDAGKCLKTLSKEKYFVKNESENWPTVLSDMKSETDSLGLTAKDECELALSALGACTFYLKKCLVDFEVLSMGQFQLYQFEDKPSNDGAVSRPTFPGIDQRMTLDSATLANLEVLQNSKGSKEGSLLERLDSCKTPFGRRLLRQWVCAPPCHPRVIESRLDAIDDLMANEDILQLLTGTLSKMPDLERMLAQIHSLSKGAQSPDHPDSRAILYEEKLYSKRKITDFMSVLQHYQSVHKCLKDLQERVCDLKSDLLRRILCLTSNERYTKGMFPDMENILLQWKKAFDHKKAKETGKIIPNPGTNPEYDLAMKDISGVLQRSEAYLKEQKRAFCCSQISYKGAGSKRFQLEIPVDKTKRISDDYEISGQRKGFKSFRTSTTIELVKELEEAESRRDAAQADSMSIIFREFSKDYPTWNAAVQLLAQLDVLVSLSLYSKGADGIMCRPVVLLPDDSCPMLDIREGRHPCVTRTLYSESFIPNDTLLGCVALDETTMRQCLLLTGPNMGGKSTLMRQVGLLVLLAQIGCYVPARSCTFTACDRVFTRLGAFDRIMSGESTFFVELGETSTILKHATRNSLVLLDELGRGTSTYDGTAIASAVLKDVSETIRCRTVFSTHYRTLVDDAALYRNVQQGHMACMVEDGDSPVEETLTFLYKLSSGACPKSYGFHAALLAGISDDVVKLAHAKASELENVKNDVALFKKVFNQSFENFRREMTAA